MARPFKYGLDYFPLDVDIFDDDKLQFVSSRFDEKGELITIKLLCKIFKAGYFIRWDEDVALLFSKGAGRNITPSLANDVVNELIKRDFFHKGLFERFAILTSAGIQKRYTKICHDAKRKDWQIDDEYNVELFTEEVKPLTTEETGQTPPETEQRKEKENRKKRERKEQGLPVFENPFNEEFLLVWNQWKEYKKMEFKFEFRSIQSEQAAVNELVKTSGGNQQKATAIIQQSMANGWKGLFELKNFTSGKNHHGSSGNTHAGGGQTAGKSIVFDNA